MKVICHEIQFRQGASHVLYVNIGNVTGTTRQRGGEAICLAARGGSTAQRRQFGLDFLEQQTEVELVLGRSIVLNKSRILPINVNAIKAIVANQVDALLGKIGARRSVGRHGGKALGQRPSANGGINFGTSFMYAMNQAVFVFVMSAILHVWRIPRAIFGIVNGGSIVIGVRSKEKLRIGPVLGKASETKQYRNKDMRNT